MYNNDTLSNGQVSSGRGNLVGIPETNPCTHCGKPDWCYYRGELSVCNGDQSSTTGWETTTKADKDGKTYYVGILEKKATFVKLATGNILLLMVLPWCVLCDSMTVKVVSLTGIKSAGVSITSKLAGWYRGGNSS
jgi:hypothetical protein